MTCSCEKGRRCLHCIENEGQTRESSVRHIRLAVPNVIPTIRRRLRALGLLKDAA